MELDNDAHVENVESRAVVIGKQVSDAVWDDGQVTMTSAHTRTGEGVEIDMVVIEAEPGTTVVEVVEDEVKGGGQELVSGCVW